MKFNHYAYIYILPGADEKKHRTVVTTDHATCITVAIDPSKKERVIDIAKALIAEGAQMLELCGGFGPLWMGRVLEAIKGAVPVGGVFYGPEARKQMVDLGLAQTAKYE